MSDTLKQIADNLGVSAINGNYLSGIADYYGVDLATSTDLMADILTEVGGDPSTSTDYLQDIVLALGGAGTINANWMEAWEAITAAPPAVPPVNTVAPLISGGLYVDDVLTTTDGTWTGSPTSYAYQWQRDATNIGTNTNTYTLVSADAGTTITCIVTATNASGSTPATSGNFSPLALAAPTIITPPYIDYTIFWFVGDTINFTGNIWDGNPAPTSFSYQWLRNGTNITGETSTTYLLDVADQDQLVSIKCDATNTQGSGSSTSNQVYIYEL